MAVDAIIDSTYVTDDVSIQVVKSGQVDEVLPICPSQVDPVVKSGQVDDIVPICPSQVEPVVQSSRQVDENVPTCPSQDEAVMLISTPSISASQTEVDTDAAETVARTAAEAMRGISASSDLERSEQGKSGLRVGCSGVDATTQLGIPSIEADHLSHEYDRSHVPHLANGLAVVTLD